MPMLQPFAARMRLVRTMHCAFHFTFFLKSAAINRSSKNIPSNQIIFHWTRFFVCSNVNTTRRATIAKRARRAITARRPRAPRTIALPAHARMCTHLSHFAAACSSHFAHSFSVVIVNVFWTRAAKCNARIVHPAMADVSVISECLTSSAHCCHLLLLFSFFHHSTPQFPFLTNQMCTRLHAQSNNWGTGMRTGWTPSAIRSGIRARSRRSAWCCWW